METALSAVLLEWLRAAASPISNLNLVDEQEVSRAAKPWFALVASSSTEWGAKDRPGREVRVAFELQTRSDDPAANTPLIAALEARIASLPPAQNGFQVVNARFLRARSERRPNNIRATLLEFRFRLLAPAQFSA